jgi:hypothetical protein
MKFDYEQFWKDKKENFKQEELIITENLIEWLEELQEFFHEQGNNGESMGVYAVIQGIKKEYQNNREE